ncbi:hypothetical protein M407DRAFT_23553 [Tulasnella calospora MUT 4182]|uniref:Protein kinase domain-containing protein n=1 Tax=Tulasnella calospora MUT 4182 TaxID=1051891 RepID=A0A0C3QAF9_9AGAM|nr:hypothetical protein M407DRAFT_23553 [Tulasnella calospora MUT 4182]
MPKTTSRNVCTPSYSTLYIFNETDTVLSKPGSQKNAEEGSQSQTSQSEISPWSKNGDVYQYLKKNPNADRRTLIHDVAEGLLYRHTRNPPIVHADIKGQGNAMRLWNSVTLAEDPTGLTTPNVGQGTTRWIAPEVLRGEPATAKAYVYSFGILALEIMSDKLPY